MPTLSLASARSSPASLLLLHVRDWPAAVRSAQKSALFCRAPDADRLAGSGLAAAGELVRTRSRRHATRVKVRRRRDFAARGVFACGASRRPLLRLCLPPTSRAVGPQRPRVAVARGRQLRSRDEAWGDWWLSAPLLASFAQLSGYRRMSLTCYVSVRAARLSCSTALSHHGVRARDTGI